MLSSLGGWRFFLGSSRRRSEHRAFRCGSFPSTRGAGSQNSPLEKTEKAGSKTILELRMKVMILQMSHVMLET